MQSCSKSSGKTTSEGADKIYIEITRRIRSVLTETGCAAPVDVANDLLFANPRTDIRALK